MIAQVVGTLLGLSVYSLLFVALALGQSREETRVDTFDRYSNRTGYLLVNPKTGRVDAFDRYSNRKNSAVIQPPPTSWQPGGRALVTPYPSSAPKK